MRPPPPLELSLEAVIESVPEARHQLARWMNRARIDLDTSQELSLVITELVTNAVEASPGPAATIHLQAELRPDAVVLLKVADQGPGFDPPDRPRLPTDNAIRGRGLPIVTALMDLLDVRRVGGRTEVTTVRALPRR